MLNSDRGYFDLKNLAWNDFFGWISALLILHNQWYLLIKEPVLSKYECLFHKSKSISATLMLLS